MLFVPSKTEWTDKGVNSTSMNECRIETPGLLSKLPLVVVIWRERER
jgi:hypothetical protein